MRWLIRIAASLLVLVLVLGAAGAVLSWRYLDPFVQRTIEEQGTRSLGVETRVDGVGIRILRGLFRVEGVSIANPPGFTRPRLLRVDRGVLNVDLGSVNRRPIEASSLRVDDVKVSIEKQASRSNYRTVLGNLKRSDDKPPPDADRGPTFVIRELVIRNIDADVRFAGAGLQVKIPEIRMHDVGGQGGVDASQITNIVLTAVIQAVASAGGLPSAIVSSLESSLSGLSPGSVEVVGEVTRLGGGLAGTGADVVKDVAEGAGKAAGKAADTVERGLGKLFK